MRLKQNKTSTSSVRKTAYYRGSSPSNQQKTQVRPLKTKVKTVAKTTTDVLLILILVFIVGYDLMLKPNPKINLNSSAYHPSGTYQSAADKLSQSFRDRIKLTYDQKGMTSSLQADFPEINRVNISLPIVGQRPTINLIISKPLFSLASAGNQFIVNQAGVIVDRGKISVVNLMALNDRSGIIPKDGEQLLSSDAIAFIEQVLAQAQSAKVSVNSITLPAQAQELDLYTKDVPYYTKFYLGGDPLVQSGQWLASRHQFIQKNVAPTQYLDVRVKGKVYYK